MERHLPLAEELALQRIRAQPVLLVSFFRHGHRCECEHRLRAAPGFTRLIEEKDVESPVIQQRVGGPGFEAISRLDPAIPFQQESLLFPGNLLNEVGTESRVYSRP